MQRGITNVEVFLLAAVLGMLAMIANPIVASDRGQRPGVACAKELRSLGTAITLYSADADDKLPIATTWQESLRPYAKRQQIGCPDSKPGGGYAFNSALSEMILSSGKTVLIFDSSKLLPNASDPLQSLPKPPRHGTGNNLLLTDLSVRFSEG